MTKLKEINPTDARKNWYQLLNQLPHQTGFYIRGRRAQQNAVLLNPKTYQHLIDNQITLTSNAEHLFYQKLNLLNDLSDLNTCFAIGQGVIIQAFHNLTSYHHGDPMWPMTTELTGCLSCYMLLANGQQINQANLHQLANQSLSNLIQRAPQLQPQNEIYQDAIHGLITSLTAMASSTTTQQNVMDLYRVTLP